MKPLYFGEEVGIHGLKITLIRSTRHNQGPCRMPRGRGRAFAESCLKDVSLCVSPAPDVV